MDHVPQSMGMQMRMVSHMSNNPEHQHFSVSNDHMGLVEQMPSNPGFNPLMVPINTLGHGGSSGVSVGLSPNGMPSQLAHEDAIARNSMTAHNASLPMKRKADMGQMVNASNTLPNKLPAHMGNSANLHGFLSPSTSHRRPGPGQTNSASPGLQTQSALNKKTTSSESMPNKPTLQRGRPPKKQTTQIESMSKSRPESSEAIRSKMRENLASALSLASQKQDNVPNSKKDQCDADGSQQKPLKTHASDSNSALNDNSSGSGSQEVPNELSVVSTNNDPLVLSTDLPPNGNSMDSGHAFPEFQYTSIFPDVDVPFSDNFFVKDDLLAGNGLSWAFDFDMQKREVEGAQNADKAKLVKEEGNANDEHGDGDNDDLPSSTPEELAFQIEAELFKLFGGVNKKYKEKGRSLLFNLKDRNNPELRERVMSGEISPDRLCSMSAEELASKELSEWRMTKAEEMAQMVVLPDTDGDMRRLVKKTHKGEYQVEFERDDGFAEEVSGGTSMFSRPHPKKKTELHSASKSLKDEENAAVQDSMLENQDLSGSLIIPTDGTDLMQGMMVDELKDTASLPPIVSLDEFMESLNSEPPFENLSSGGLQKSSEPHKEERLNDVSKFKASDQAADSPKDASSKKVDFVKKQESDTTIKSSKSPKQNVIPSIAADAENIWEGALQLNVSSSVTVFSQFQSGEKTSVKEWPSSLEIKGRVRLDAFEKFLQELPMSRTRAVMVLHINLKDKSSQREGREFSEAVESYSTDERLGFIEPAPGIELYLCPPTPRMAEMLNKHLPKHHRPETTTNISAQNGLIGVVVWRRAHMSSNNISSPNSSSAHNKHMKKQLSFSSSITGPNRMQNSSKVNVSSSTLYRPPTGGSVVNKPVQPEPDEEDEDEDDIPPGFGPGTAKKDDDDLPEFNFSSHLNPHTPVPKTAPQNLSPHGLNMMLPPQRPVDQVRELIKKYGQIGTSTGGGAAVTSTDRSLGIEPWNDDDDDIPEWRPEAPPQMVHGHWPPGQLHPRGSPQRPRGGVRPPPTGRWPPQGPRWRPY